MEIGVIQTLTVCIATIFVLLAIIACFTILEKQIAGVKSLLYDRYVKFDPKIDQLVELAINYWRLRKHLEKIKPQLSPEDTRRIESSLCRIEAYLRENDIEVSDYTGRSANDGINVEIISIEHDSSLKKPIIKETIAPAVTYKGSLRKKAQVIILDNIQDKEQPNDDKQN